MTDQPSRTSGIPFIIAWIWFTLLGILVIAYGIYGLTLREAQPTHWDWLTSSEEVLDYLDGTFNALGVVASGLGVMTTLTAVTGLRQRERSAWYALWIYPLLFLLAIPFTWPGFFWSPFVVISIASLLVTRRTVFNA